jgi:hypothetical protein
LFGAIGGGWYKMCKVDADGTVLQSLAMSPSLSLTEANWNEATQGGAYSVEDFSSSCAGSPIST